MGDNFNYDSDDVELDENGLPVDVITDDDDNNDESLIDKAKDTYDTYQDTKNTIEKIEKAQEKSEQAKKTADTAKTATDTAKAAKKASDAVKAADTGVKTVKVVKTTSDGVKIAKVVGTTAKAGGAAGGGGLMAAIGPALPYIGIALLIILAIILIITIISAVIAWVDGKTNENALKTNSYITSAYFYGIRTAYTDDQVLLDALQLSYKQYAVDLITRLGDNPEITINITLPNNFDNATDINNNITNISLAMGNIVANNLSDYAGVDFATLYPNISYFGLTSTQSNTLNTFLGDYLVDNNVISIAEGSTLNLSTELENLTSSDELSYIFNLCEKVMIKDFIATETGLEGLEKAKFVGSVYMANTTVTLSNMSYVINNQHADRTAYAKLVELTDGTETVLMEKSLDENASDVEILNTAGSTKVTLQKFTSINEENPALYSQGLTLFNAMKLAEGQYFKQIEIDYNGSKVMVYSWKPIDENALYLEFGSVGRFMFGEFNLKVE